jgi:hypothetical protein
MIHIRKSAVTFAAAMAMVTVVPAHASDDEKAPFSALQSVDAQPLSSNEMQQVSGQSILAIVSALRTAGYTTLATAYTGTVLNSRIFINRVLVRR